MSTHNDPMAAHLHAAAAINPAIFAGLPDWRASDASVPAQRNDAVTVRDAQYAAGDVRNDPQLIAFAERHQLTSPPVAQGLTQEDLATFVAGFLITHMELSDELELPNDPDHLVAQVWACMDLGLTSDDKLVRVVLEAAQRALKPIRP